jgi:hypothetical protein
MGLTARRTNKSAFVWAMLICAALSYNFSYSLFQDLARMLVHRGAVAVHEQRLPLAFYGLTYLPLLIGLAGTATWARRKGNELFAQPVRQFVTGLSCLLLAAAFQHPKAVFPVGTAMAAMFALQIGLFRNRLLIIPAVAAFLAAGFGLAEFARNVWEIQVPPDMKLLCLSTAAIALLYPGRRIDRLIESLPDERSSGDFSPVHLFCQRVSLAVTLILATCWFGLAVASATPAEVMVSQTLLLSLLAVHALVWNTPRLVEAALSFAGAGAIIHAVLLHVPPADIVADGTLALLVLWGCTHVPQRWFGKRISDLLRPACRNVSGVCLTLLLLFYYLPDLAHDTLTGQHLAAWGLLVMVVLWMFDAARRFASPLHAVVGCFGVVGLATAGVTEWLGVAASREWLLTTWGAAAFAGVAPAVLLGRCHDRREAARDDSPDGEERRSAVWALAAPVWIVVLGSLLGVAAISTVLFSMPARIAGMVAVAGLLWLGHGRRMAEVQQTGLIALNWQLLSLLVQINVPGVKALLPLSPDWLIPCSLPLALATAVSGQLVRLLNPREHHEYARELLKVHTVVLNMVMYGALLASLGHLEQGLTPQQILMSACTFAIVVVAAAWDACWLNQVERVWWSEAVAGMAVAYFLLFHVIHFGSGIAPFVVLGTGLGLWGIGHVAERRPAIAVLSGPFSLTGVTLPLAAALLATGRHLAGFSTSLLGMHSLALFAAAAFYFWRGIEDRRKPLVVLSAAILNGSLVLLWRDLHWTDPQLFMMPLGLSVLGLVELLHAEIPEPMHNPLRYAGALVILVSPTFHIVGGSWLHLATLLAAAVGVTLLSIGLRVRALMYTGVAFVVADLIAMVIRGSIDRPNLLWIAGIGVGTAVLILAALCENRREVMLQKLRVLTAELETWR